MCGDLAAAHLAETVAVAGADDEVEMGSYSEVMSAQTIVETADKVQLWSENENQLLAKEVEVSLSYLLHLAT